MNSLETPSDSMQTRPTLVARVRDISDQASWDEFVSLYKPLLTSFVASRGLNESDANDVVQNIFIKLLRELPVFQLDHEQGRFRTWLYRLTANAVIDFARQRKRQSRLAEEVEAYRKAEALADVDDSVAFAKEHQRRVLSFVLDRVRGEFKPQTWKCFEQTAIIRRPAAEVARELELNVSNVYVNSSRVLAKVREQCAEFMESLSDDELLPNR